MWTDTPAPLAFPGEAPLQATLLQGYAAELANENQKPDVRAAAGLQIKTNLTSKVRRTLAKDTAGLRLSLTPTRPYPSP